MADNFFDKKIKSQIIDQISILDIAKEYGLTPFQKGTHYSLREHDSVVIYPETNSFFRHKTSFGGTVFQFMQEMPEINMRFSDVYFLLKKRIDTTIEPKKFDKEVIKKPKETYKKITNTFNLNESLNQCEQREKVLMSQFKKDLSIKNARGYLIKTRCIDPDIVDEFIFKGLIRQDRTNGHKNVAFIGYNDVGFVCAICKKSCLSHGKFKGDVAPSNYAYGWRYDPDIKNYRNLFKTEFYNPDKTLICFEGYIDMLAYISILKDKNIDYKQYSYITCGSVTKYMSVVAAARNNHYKKVICAFDNDEAGDHHAILLAKALKHECGDDIIVKRQKSFLKDWDEDRIAIKNHDKSILVKIKRAKEQVEKQQLDLSKKKETPSLEK